MMDDRYMSLKELSEYSGMSIRSLRSKLRGVHPIPHFNSRKKALVKKSEFDLWMERYRVINAEISPEQLDTLVNGICHEIFSVPKKGNT